MNGGLRGFIYLPDATPSRALLFVKGVCTYNLAAVIYYFWEKAKHGSFDRIVIISLVHFAAPQCTQNEVAWKKSIQPID